MVQLYSELLQRLEYLESLKKSDSNDGRILELQLVIIRVQQLLISDIKPNRDVRFISSNDAESHNQKMFMKFGLPEGYTTIKKHIQHTSLIDANEPDIDTNLSLSEEEIEILLFVEDKCISFIDNKISNRDILYDLSDKNLLKIAGEFWELTDKGYDVVKLLKSFK